MPYFPDIVPVTGHHADSVYLYLGDQHGHPMFTRGGTPYLPGNATIETRDARRQWVLGEIAAGRAELGNRYGVELRIITEHTDEVRSLAGNDVMIDSTGSLYIWMGRRTGDGASSWLLTSPEGADQTRRDRDENLSCGGYSARWMSRAQWENHATFTDPEPSIPAQADTRVAATLTSGEPVTFTPLDEAPATPAPNTVLHAAGGYFLIPAGTNTEGAPLWMSISTERSSWTNIQARHTSAWRGREGQQVPSRDTFANWSGRLREVRPMTPEDLPPDIIDGRGRLWLHVGWHEGPRYKLAPGPDARYRNLIRRERMRSQAIVDVPEMGFNVARSWTDARIEREHRISQRATRTRMPERLVGFGDTSVNPGEVPAPPRPVVGVDPAGPAATVDPWAHVRPGPHEGRASRDIFMGIDDRGRCRDSNPQSRWTCTRPSGHPGQHIASNDSEVVGVWHGSHFLNVRPSAGVGDSPEEYTAYLRTAGAAAPTDPVAMAIAAAERAERELAEYRERVRARAIQGRDVDHEYSSDEALNVSLRNLGLPERKVKYAVPVTLYVTVEDARDETQAMDRARLLTEQMRGLSMPSGLTAGRAAVGSPSRVTS